MTTSARKQPLARSYIQRLVMTLTSRSLGKAHSLNWIEFMRVSITSFAKIPVIAAVLLSVPAAASDECTFSDVGILENIKRVASAHPGASVDSERLRAFWELDADTIEYFEAGGCYDYGQKAGRATQTTEVRDVDAVLRVAIDLAQKFMTEQDRNRVNEAIDDGAYETIASDETDTRIIGHPFGEVVISHSFADGTDTVEIAWPVY